ncbi:hypothetical protein [Nocardia sp. NPDC048505]|uniref:hypothetical protein n=1 Tax=unclassified Nocardia TaxID=2637762 RepID=UPI00340C2F2E
MLDSNLRTYRKTVATATAHAKGFGAAGRQLNHAPGSRTTAAHYVEQPRDVPDNRDVLDLYFAPPLGTEVPQNLG